MAATPARTTTACIESIWMRTRGGGTGWEPPTRRWTGPIWIPSTRSLAHSGAQPRSLPHRTREQLAGHQRISVICGGRHAEDVTHRVVNVHVLEGRHDHTASKGRARGHKQRPHRRHGGIIAVRSANSTNVALPEIDHALPLHDDPPIVGDSNDGRDSWMISIVPVRRRGFATVDAQMRMGVLQLGK